MMRELMDSKFIQENYKVKGMNTDILVMICIIMKIYTDIINESRQAENKESSGSRLEKGK